MTGFDAIEYVFDKLELMSLSLDGGIYQFSKPVNIEETEFIVVNTLAVADGILQKANVNINIFVQDVVPGTPNNGRLKTIMNEVLSQFPFAESGSDIQAFRKDTDIISDSEFNRHFVNVRLEVMMLNV